MEEVVEQKKELPSRASRGKRMSALLDEENEADESFWNQEYFKEEAEDTVYEQQEEEEDVVDDDFDLPENDVFEPEEDEEAAKKSDRQPKKKSVYVDPKGQAALQREKKRQKRTIKPKVKEIESDDDYSENESDELEEPSKATGKETPKTDRQMRDSTKTLSMEKKVARERRQKELQRRRAERGPRRRTYYRKISQKDLLEETKITEEINKASLEILLAIEEERKKLPQLKTIIQGPIITFHSKDGQSTLTFSDNKIPDIIKQKPQEYPPKLTCVITGLPAKYVDPKTGLPYATIPAFKQLRQQYGHLHPTELPRSIFFPKPVPEPEPVEPEPTPMMPAMIEEPVMAIPQVPIKKKKEHKRKKKKDKYYDFYP
mmetsp:Transcript_16801/g.23376  ORF Transcript_16801/g.23376 Transcript_16801/m.23376 type:complete len:373 (-) Transcript_16801:69-1187(-)